MCLGSKSKENDLISEDRTHIPLTLEHEVFGLTLTSIFMAT